MVMDYAKSCADVTAVVEERLEPGETVEGVLPFALVPRQPKHAGGTRVGIRQRSRRYRPIMITDRRLFLLDTGRTPYPRGVLAEFRNRDVGVVQVTPGRLGTSTVVLDLGGMGEIPFVVGRYETNDLARLVAVLGPARDT
jgi:hypothetical protein